LTQDIVDVADMAPTTAPGEGGPESPEQAPTESPAEAPRPARRRRRSSGSGPKPKQPVGDGEGPEAAGDTAAIEVSPPVPAVTEMGEKQPPAETTPSRPRRRRRSGRRPADPSATGTPEQDVREPGASVTSSLSPAPSEAAAVPAPVSDEAAAPTTAPRAEVAEVRQPGPRRRRRGVRRPKVEHVAPQAPRMMLVTVGPERSQIAVLEGRELIEHYVAQSEDRSIVGNVYVGRVQNVLPGMEAAFLDIGEVRNAVLYVGEVSYEEEVEGPAPRIETLLKSGQAVLAQVTKDPMGSKGARLTTEVSIAGRYLVLVPESSSVGISRRLPDNERRRLRDIAHRIRPDGHGMIVRTAAAGAGEQDLERDVSRLVRIWEEVLSKSNGAKPPKLVYSEPPLAIRVVRDLFTAEVEQVNVDNESVFKEIRDYLGEVTPELGDRVELYEESMALFERYNVREQIRKAVDRKVWLPSGGHIVIDRTEAMTVIDVNTGRFVGRSNLEETVLRTNLEAAEEIAKQLRLRDIGGIIVIDFIDMGYERNREELLRVFNNALLRDKTRTQVYGVSELGLVQMTRKKVSEGLLEAFSRPCEVCEGRGVILSDI
jgi:ribonuclease E